MIGTIALPVLGVQTEPRSPQAAPEVLAKSENAVTEAWVEYFTMRHDAIYATSPGERHLYGDEVDVVLKALARRGLHDSKIVEHGADFRGVPHAVLHGTSVHRSASEVFLVLMDEQDIWELIHAAHEDTTSASHLRAVHTLIAEERKGRERLERILDKLADKPPWYRRWF